MGAGLKNLPGYLHQPMVSSPFKIANGTLDALIVQPRFTVAQIELAKGAAIRPFSSTS
jgi:hypothetical protein